MAVHVLDVVLPDCLVAIAFQRTWAETHEEEGTEQPIGVIPAINLEWTANAARHVASKNTIKAADVILAVLSTGLRLRRSRNQRTSGHFATLPALKVGPNCAQSSLRSKERGDPSVSREDEITKKEVLLFRLKQIVGTNVFQIDAKRIIGAGLRRTVRLAPSFYRNGGFRFSRSSLDMVIQGKLQLWFGRRQAGHLNPDSAVVNMQRHRAETLSV
jgi:hypothetical protein